jgi:hypothetical protein
MVADDTYIARRLQRIGDWDAALAVLGPDADPEVRADVAVDRWFFRIEDHDEAEKAVAQLAPDTPTAQFLLGKLAYSRLLFRHQPRPDDREVAEAAFRAALAATEDELQRGWAEFFLGTLLDNIDGDPAAALPRFETAHQIALATGDWLLESTAIRHIAPQKEREESLQMFRRSLHLRAAIGARPQILAAQASLADQLPEDDPERTDLTEAFRAGAEELRIGWLLSDGEG